MGRLSDTRQVLFEAIQLVFPGAEWRAHKHPPDQLVSPCAWVDVPSVSTSALGRSGTTVVSTWQVYLVVDGAESSAVDLLDDATARAWDALDALERIDCTGASPRSIDIGGVNGRAMVISLTATHMARSLCQPLLAQATP